MLGLQISQAEICLKTIYTPANKSRDTNPSLRTTIKSYLS